MPRKLTTAERQRLEDLLANDQQLYAALVFEPDDLGAVVRGHAYVEVLLERLLERNMKREGIVRWYSLDILRRLEIARSFGEIDDALAAAIHALAEIRNGVAHNPGFTVLEGDVTKFVRAMERAVPDAMSGIENMSPNMFVRLYGKHGRVLRVGMLFLKWILQARLLDTEPEPLDLFILAEEIFARPLPSSGTFRASDFPFDERGMRRRSQ